MHLFAEDRTILDFITIGMQSSNNLYLFGGARQRVTLAVHLSTRTERSSIITNSAQLFRKRSDKKRIGIRVFRSEREQ